MRSSSVSVIPRENPRTAHQVLKAREKLGKAFLAGHSDRDGERAAWWRQARDLVGGLLHDVLTLDVVRVPPSDAVEDPDVRVEHSIEEGTVAHFHRDDAIGQVMRRAGFLWVPSKKVWRRQASVGRVTTTAPLEYIRSMLHQIGKTVAFDIAAPTAAEASQAVKDARARRAEYLRERGEMYADRAGRAEARSDAAYQRARSAVAGIEPGQPILVGHHSERHHRRAHERHDTAMRAAIDERSKASHASDRADSREAEARKVEHAESRVARDQRVSLIATAVSRGIKRETGALAYQGGIARYASGVTPRVDISGGAWRVSRDAWSGGSQSLSGSHSPTDEPADVAAAIFRALREMFPPLAADLDYPTYAKKHARKLFKASKVTGVSTLTVRIPFPELAAEIEVAVVPGTSGYRVFRSPWHSHHESRVPIATTTGDPATALAVAAEAVRAWAPLYVAAKRAEDAADAASRAQRFNDADPTEWRRLRGIYEDAQKARQALPG